MFDDLDGARVTVMGLGRFGGGVGATRFLVEQGARVTLTDSADEATLADSLTQIADRRPERIRLDGHDEQDFTDADLIVASPAVPRNHPCLQAADSAGVPVTTEIGLFWCRCQAPIVGVTGSVGKSTTAAMIHSVLVAAGRKAWLGGNIGGSLLPHVDQIGHGDWVVLELSSFQLEYLAPLEPRPAVAVVTNLRPNHLDRHGTFEAYRAAKQNLLRWQTPTDVAVLNVGDPYVASWTTRARISWFGRAADDPALAAQASRFAREPERPWPATISRLFKSFAGSSSTERVAGRSPPTVLTLSSDHAVLAHDGAEPTLLFLDLRLAGEHHRTNAAAATAAALAVGVDPAAIGQALNKFGGLPHRCEIVGDFAGRLWVNDSKATTPESAIAALDSFDRPIRLVAGGADKSVDLASFADAIVRRGASVDLSGRTADSIARLLHERGHGDVRVHQSFDDSVAAAWAASQPGDVVLLSPACASWGQFRDYRERGERFASLAQTLSEQKYSSGSV